MLNRRINIYNYINQIHHRFSFASNFLARIFYPLGFQVVAERLARDGENVLKVKKKNPFLADIVHFFSGFSLIMWVGAALW